MSSDQKLPPLPATSYTLVSGGSHTWLRGWDEKSVRAYGEACAAAGRSLAERARFESLRLAQAVRERQLAEAQFRALLEEMASARALAPCVTTVALKPDEDPFLPRNPNPFTMPDEQPLRWP
jgi:hypothetical protein